MARRCGGSGGRTLIWALAAAGWACTERAVGGDGGPSDAAGTDAGRPDAGAYPTCAPCLTGADCTPGWCVQGAVDSVCARPCAFPAECSAAEICVDAVDFASVPLKACLPPSRCGPNLDGGDDDAGPQDAGAADAGASDGGARDAGAADAGACSGLSDPYTPGCCASCTVGAGNCHRNGCFGGWWCRLADCRCQPPPSGCSGTSPDAGPITGSVGATGGRVSRLWFAVVGDTRPANPDDNAGYPTAVITRIYQDLAALRPVLQFAIATGDYIFASPGSGNAAVQLGTYATARANYPGVLFPAMGNHECTGYTASNCGPGNANGTPDNYREFVSRLLSPIGQTRPYFQVRVDSDIGAWTAKFVFVAANAWDATQDSWLRAAMAVPTTYTFVIRHEPAAATTAPGTTPSENIVRSYPLTLKIVGHTHTFWHVSPREVIVGNGGAPISGTTPFGYATFEQVAGGWIEVVAFDERTDLPFTSFHVPP